MVFKKYRRATQIENNRVDIVLQFLEIPVQPINIF